MLPVLLSLLLPPLLLSCSCLQLSPLRSGYLPYDSVRLSCEDDGLFWKVKRSTSSSGVRACLSGWGSKEPGASCVIKNIYPSDVGSYWCESEEGERGEIVNITIIPEPPASSACPSPPLNHQNLGHEDQHVSHKTPQIDGIKGDSTTNPAFKESAVNMTVTDSSLSSSSCSVSVLRVLRHVLVSAPYLVSTVLLGLIYRDQRKASQVDVRRRGRHDVIMEIQV